MFGLVYWLLDGIKDSIETATSPSGDVYSFMVYAWIGSIIIYLLFGGIWVARKYAEQEYRGGL